MKIEESGNNPWRLIQNYIPISLMVVFFFLFMSFQLLWVRLWWTLFWTFCNWLSFWILLLFMWIKLLSSCLMCFHDWYLLTNWSVINLNLTVEKNGIYTISISIIIWLLSLGQRINFIILCEFFTPNVCY